MRVVVDEDRFEELGVSYSRAGDVAILRLPGQPDPITARVADGMLLLIPDRSAGHRRLQSLLAG